ncbi:MAG: DNA polymerase III subunit delta [Clostridiales bacterium]|jgi:DNA polymerase-3 subunit delta|nr:DNA polymerase III subunit delta [Clostridiales bacterium]
MKNLKTDLSKNALKTVYLFYGEERYLLNAYEKKIKDKAVDPAFELMNTDKFDGKAVVFDDVKNALETSPFMSEKRLVVLRDTALFKAGRKDQTEAFAGTVEHLPDTTVTVFVESEVDKRNKLYKAVGKAGRCVEFKTPGERELAEWVCSLASKANKKISYEDALYMTNIVTKDMSVVERETAKLIDYAGQNDVITREFVDAACVRSFETRAFDLADAITAKDANTALEIFNNMLLVKMSPIMVISMIARQFRNALACRLLSDAGRDFAQIVAETGQSDWIVRRNLEKSARFSATEMKNALADCLEADLSVKTGKMDDKTAVELIIIRYALNAGLCPDKS